MSENFTETSHVSWGSRIKDSIKGILFGIVLIIAAVVLLFWNEGRTVKQTKALKEGASVVVTVPIEQVSAENEGKLVHLTGKAETSDVLMDDIFRVSENAIRLSRIVEMYQWKENQKTEEKKNVGGSVDKTTTYTYEKGWADYPISSGNFKQQEGHQNPSAFPFEGATKYSKNVNVGAFKLNETLIAKISGSENADISKIDTSKFTGSKISGNILYIGKGNSASPVIGDVKVAFNVVRPKDVSIVAKQIQNTFEPYITSNGKSIILLSTGIVSSEAMFASALRSNKLVGWFLRVLGIILISAGFGMILKPLSVLADVVPFIGTIVGIGTGLISGILALVIGLVTIAIAWIYYRPVLGISLLVAALVLIFYMVRLKKKKKAAVAATE